MLDKSDIEEKQSIGKVDACKHGRGENKNKRECHSNRLGYGDA